MKVSVCLSAYNVERWIEEAIQSVLDQTFTDFELLICENGSVDKTRQCIEQFTDPRIKIFYNNINQGSYNGYRVLLDAAQGDYIAMLGGDDILTPTSLAMRALTLDLRANLAAVFCQPEHIQSNGKPFTGDHAWKFCQNVPNCDRDQWRRRFREANYFNVSQLMYRRSLFQTIGYPDPSYRLLCDLDYYIRMLDAGDLFVIPKALAKIRIRDDGTNESAPTPENLKTHAEEMARLRRKHTVPMKLMIATPFYENKGYSPYIRSMFQTVYALARHTKLEFDFQEVSGGSYIDNNRNMMADTFMKSDSTHLMFIDSDQSWDLQGFFNVLKADKDMVGAAYPVKNNWEHYGVEIHTDENFRPLVDENGLIKAAKVPTGFMKISRKVFADIKAANPDDWYYHGDSEKLQNYFGHLTIDHVRYGEDISFNIRWLRTGGEIWLEPRVSMGHFGAQGWFGNYHEYLMKQPGGSNAHLS